MTPPNFLIVRLGAMGDVLHALPAVSALRQAERDAKIHWVIDPRWAPLLCAGKDAIPRSDAMPLVDHIHLADTKAWSHNPISNPTLQSILKLRRDLRKTHYELVIDLQGSIRSAIISRFARNSAVIGSSTPRETPACWFYSQGVVTRSAHVIDQAAEITGAAIGQLLTPQPTPLPRGRKSEKWYEQLASSFAQNTRFAVITPGAGWGAKRWPAERYGQVAAGLADLGLTVLVNSGPGEAHLAAEVITTSDGNARAADCTLPQLIALLRHTALFIGGDTGPLHLAAALGVPVVGLYGPTDPARNGPYGTKSIVLRHPSSRLDYTRHTATESGLLAIPATAALDAARSLLQQSNQGPYITVVQDF